MEATDQRLLDQAMIELDGTDNKACLLYTSRCV